MIAHDIPSGSGIVVRPAEFDDAPRIYAILESFSSDRVLLPRSIPDIRARISNFLIAERNGKSAGCGALRDFGGHLYEIRSLAVHRDSAGQGIGSLLVRSLLEKARKGTMGDGVHVFALTYRVSFFLRLGFSVVDKHNFPPKIWSDCSICPKKDHCDETAVAIDIPTYIAVQSLTTGEKV